MKPIILHVEDDAPTYRAMRSLLRQDFEVRPARDLASALAALGDSPAPAGVILDLMLPDGDGLTVLKEIRRRGLTCLVVVTTGVREGPHLRSVRDLGPSAIIAKPCDFSDITGALLPLLNHQGS